jgi:TldD protein
MTSATFPMDHAIAARLIEVACSKGAAFGELYLERRVVTSLTLADGRIESVEQGITAGCGVRAVDGERVGYAFADSFDPAVIEEAARNAAAIADRGAGAGSGVVFLPVIPPDLVQAPRTIVELEDNSRAQWLLKADAAARAYDPAVTQATITYTDEVLQFAVINSDGLWIEDRLPLLYLRLNVNASKPGGQGLGTHRVSHRSGLGEMSDEVAANAGTQAARMAVAMCDARPSPSGEMTVVLASGGGVLFHEAVGHGLEGDVALRGTSFYTGKIGQRVGSAKVSVVDTGAMPALRGSYNVDDEGTVPERNVLIEKGVLRGFLTDRIVAKGLDLPRTGNGRRQSYRFPPLVRMSNTFIEPGTDDPEAIIRETRRGLFARSLGGGEVDTTSGNFTFGVQEAYLIEDGKLKYPVRGANLVGNGPEIMTRIDRVGPDLGYWVGTCGKGQWVPVTCGAPTLRISSMTVGGVGQG